MTTRDGWCTPSWLTNALPDVDLDPCSNHRSTVRAGETYSIESGLDGLELPWFGLVFVNGPYSNLLPWARKLVAERENVTGAGFLVNTDSSTMWWRVLTGVLPVRLDFAARVRFTPPHGVRESTNNRPQTLLMDEMFWSECDQAALLARGTLWRQY